jgi:hypothetical protein
MIAKTINTLLTGGSSLVTLVGTKIFPYVMNENTELPAIVYTVDSLSPEYTKGGWSGDYIQFSVHSFSKSYTELQNVVDAVRDAVELKETGYSGQEISRITLTSQEEGFDNEAGVFYNKQTYNVKLNNY